MLFNTLSYAIFLPIVFILYWLLPRTRWQNVFLLTASYMFYAIGDWRFLGLLFGMSLLSWLVGRYPKKVLVVVSVVVDLLILGFFKYYNFFAESFAILFGANPDSVTLKLVLPLGISFFTFQAISYAVDAYRGNLQSAISNQQSSIDSLINCLLYIAFFPKLLAGPIERPTHLLPQIQQKRVFEYDTAVDGCRQILWGLFKKVVVADNCATYVNAVYADYANQSGSTLLLAAILYTIQIYGDFSGYSDMAIGSAKLLGFKFRDNFLFPYFSRNMGEFWKRWHISLNTWFVDYVYIPLGGSRGTRLSPLTSHLSPEARVKCATIRNTFIIFLLSGLWHGADWSFVAWGGYHGLLLVILILLNRNTKYEHVVAYGRWFPSIKEFGQMVLVFILATIGWMMFRADNINIFILYCQQMCDRSICSVPWLMNKSFYLSTFLCIVLMMLVEWLNRHKCHGLDLSGIHSHVVKFSIYLVFIILIFWFGAQAETFIYSQF